MADFIELPLYRGGEMTFNKDHIARFTAGAREGCTKIWLANTDPESQSLFELGMSYEALRSALQTKGVAKPVDYAEVL